MLSAKSYFFIFWLLKPHVFLYQSVFWRIKNYLVLLLKVFIVQNWGKVFAISERLQDIISQSKLISYRRYRENMEICKYFSQNINTCMVSISIELVTKLTWNKKNQSFEMKKQICLWNILWPMHIFPPDIQ